MSFLAQDRAHYKALRKINFGVSYRTDEFVTSWVTISFSTGSHSLGLFYFLVPCSEKLKDRQSM